MKFRYSYAPSVITSKPANEGRRSGQVFLLRCLGIRQARFGSPTPRFSQGSRRQPNESWTSNCLPSASVSMSPVALCDPSRAGHIFMVMELERATVSLRKLILEREFGGAMDTCQVTTLPSGPFTSMASDTWGFSHLISDTLPLTVNSLLVSYVSSTLWWAKSGTDQKAIRNTQVRISTRDFMSLPLSIVGWLELCFRPILIVT